MTIFWNGLEILRLIDSCEEGERGGIQCSGARPRGFAHRTTLSIA